MSCDLTMIRFLNAKGAEITFYSIKSMALSLRTGITFIDMFYKYN